MTRIITFILTLVTAISVNAQNYTYNFSSTPLSEALLLISREHPELSIHFIYNELEDYTTSARVSTTDPYEAIRRTVALNPVTVLQQDNNFYLEAMQHGKYRYKGKVLGSDGEAVAAATVILLEPKDSTVLTYGITTDDGRFLIPCDKTDVIAKVNCLGYMPTFHRCTSFNVGTITMKPLPLNLKNVTIKAQNAAIYTDKTIYIPTPRQKNAAQNAIDLLRHMAIPQIKVNSINGSVTDNFANNVVIYINNLEASKEEMGGLRTGDVKKVEFLEFPSDPRYRGAEKVINIIVTEYVYGGYTKLSASEKFLTGLLNRVNVFSKFTYKHMTYDLYVGATNRNSHHNGNSTQEIYTLLNDKKEPITVERNETIENSDVKENHYPVTFRATYNSEKVQIRNTLGFTHYSQPRKHQQGALFYRPSSINDEAYTRNNIVYNNSVSYSGTYSFMFPKSVSVDITPQVNYSHNNDITIYSPTIFQSIYRKAREDAYYSRIDAYARKKVGQKHSLLIGTNGSLSGNRLRYTGTSEYKDNFTHNFAALKFGYNIQLQKVAIDMDAGVAWEKSDINGFKIDDWYPFTHINIRYSLNNKNALSTYFQYATFSPGISDKSSDILRNNEFMYITGNPSLKNSRISNLNLSYNWLPSNEFGLNIYSRLFAIYNRAVLAFNHYDEGKAIIRKIINNGDYVTEVIGAAVSWKLLNGNLQFYANPEQKFIKTSGLYRTTFNPFTLSLQLSYYLNNFYFNVNYDTPEKEFAWRTNIKYQTFNYYSITVGWSKSDFNLRLIGANFFNKGWKNATNERCMPLYSSFVTELGTTYHPSIIISATYTFGYGKKVQRGNEVGAQSGAASAILK